MDVTLTASGNSGRVTSSYTSPIFTRPTQNDAASATKIMMEISKKINRFMSHSPLAIAAASTWRAHHLHCTPQSFAASRHPAFPTTSQTTSPNPRRMNPWCATRSRCIPQCLSVNKTSAEKSCDRAPSPADRSCWRQAPRVNDSTNQNAAHSVQQHDVQNHHNDRWGFLRVVQETP